MSGYELDDPKHPDFHSVHADIWDNRDKFATATTAVYVLTVPADWPPSLTGVHIPFAADDALVWAIGRESELREARKSREFVERLAE